MAFLKKLIIFLLIFLAVWDFMKTPYYLGYHYDLQPDGLDASVTIEQWFPGYKGSKLHFAPGNFILVHFCFGAILLVMSALFLVNRKWLKNYGGFFFVFSLSIGVHGLPAGWDFPDKKKWLFTLANVLCILCAVWGFNTLRTYDSDPIGSEARLSWQFGIVAFINCGGGFLEVISIKKRVDYLREHGEYLTEGPGPSPEWGHGFYQILPDYYGKFFFAAFIVVVGILWPVSILKLADPAAEEATKEEKVALVEDPPMPAEPEIPVAAPASVTSEATPLTGGKKAKRRGFFGSRK